MHALCRLSFVVGLVTLVSSLLAAGDARADASQGARGLVVVAEGDAGASASSLARAIYGDPGLLPSGLDEGHARALAGGVVALDAPREIKDLAETRAAIHGDDAPSRSLLAGLAASLHVRGLVVVEGQPGDKPVARVFVAGTGAFDTVVYEPDPAPVSTWGSAPAGLTWASAVNALHRGFAESIVAIPAPPTMTPAPAAALQATPAPVQGDKSPGGSRPFYASPWFWGAIGAAAFAGAAFYFATRDSSDPNIQLQVQVPR